jgi:hypothetical protein
MRCRMLVNDSCRVQRGGVSLSGMDAGWMDGLGDGETNEFSLQGFSPTILFPDSSLVVETSTVGRDSITE